MTPLCFCYLFNRDISIFFMSIIAKDFLLLILGEGSPPTCLSLFILPVNVSWSTAGSHYHIKICRFKIGVSRNIGKDASQWVLSLSSALSAQLLDCPLVRIHRKKGAAEIWTMQAQVSRTCSFSWIPVFLEQEQIYLHGLDLLCVPMKYECQPHFTSTQGGLWEFRV